MIIITIFIRHWKMPDKKRSLGVEKTPGLFLVYARQREEYSQNQGCLP